MCCIEEGCTLSNVVVFYCFKCSCIIFYLKQLYCTKHSCIVLNQRQLFVLYQRRLYYIVSSAVEMYCIKHLYYIVLNEAVLYCIKCSCIVLIQVQFYCIVSNTVVLGYIEELIKKKQLLKSTVGFLRRQVKRLRTSFHLT